MATQVEPPKDYEGQVALITGGAGGIGMAVAATLARRMCKLCLVDLSQAALDAHDIRARVPTAMR